MDRENIPFRVPNNETTQFVRFYSNRYLSYTICNCFPRKREIYFIYPTISHTFELPEGTYYEI